MMQRRTTRRTAAPRHFRPALVVDLGLRNAGRTGPWQRTETRQPCASFDMLRQPYFGDTHVHTAYSSDAVFAGTREDPRGAYRFAQGQPIGLPPYDAQGMPTRTAQLRRPLDFTAVTDHAEQFGEIQICLTPGLSGLRLDATASSARTQLATPPPPLPTQLPPSAGHQLPARLRRARPRRSASRGAGPTASTASPRRRSSGRTRRPPPRSSTTAPRRAPSRPSSPTSGAASPAATTCTATSSSATPSSRRCRPATWSSRRRRACGTSSRRQCLDGLPGCDVLAIPHNPNVSGGLMFAPVNADGSPLTAADAAFRVVDGAARRDEPAQGRLRVPARRGRRTDELCGFEKLNRLQLFSPVSDPNQTFPPLNYVRNALQGRPACRSRRSASTRSSSA